METSPDESSLVNPSLCRYQCLRTISNQAAIFCVALHGDMLCSGCWDDQIQVWRHSDATHLATLNGGKSGAVPVMALLMVGQKLFSAHQDGKIKVWRFSKANHTQHRLITTLPTLRDSIARLLSPKETRKSTFSPIQHSDAVSALAFGDNVVYSGSWDKTVKVWRLSDLKFLESILVHEVVTALAANPQASFLYLATSGSSTVKVLEKITTSKSLSQHQLVQVLQEVSPINALAVCPTGSLLYTGSTNSSISVWERQKCPHMCLYETLEGHRREILCLATKDDILCSGSADKTTRIWRKSAVDSTHTCLAMLQHGGPVSCVALSTNPFGSCTVYVGSPENQIKVWRVSDICRNNSTLEEHHHKQREKNTTEMVHWKLDAIKYALDEGSFHLVFQTLQC